MSVNPETLNNQEQGMSLVTRESKAKKGNASSDATAELTALQKRIAAAKLDRALDRDEILKHDREPHCGDCFARGWASAVTAIDGD